MSKFKEKCSAVRKVVRSEESIVITLRNGEFDFQLCGDSQIIHSLYLRLIPYVKTWKLRWDKMNSQTVVPNPIADVGEPIAQKPDIPIINDVPEIGNLKPSKDDAFAQTHK